MQIFSINITYFPALPYILHSCVNRPKCFPLDLFLGFFHDIAKAPVLEKNYLQWPVSKWPPFTPISRYSHPYGVPFPTGPGFVCGPNDKIGCRRLQLPSWDLSHWSTLSQSTCCGEGKILWTRNATCHMRKQMMLRPSSHQLLKLPQLCTMREFRMEKSKILALDS